MRTYGFGNAVNNVQDVWPEFLAEIDAVSASHAPHRMNLWYISLYEGPSESLRCLDFDPFAHVHTSSLMIWCLFILCSPTSTGSLPGITPFHGRTDEANLGSHCEERLPEALTITDSKTEPTSATSPPWLPQVERLVGRFIIFLPSAISEVRL